MKIPIFILIALCSFIFMVAQPAFSQQDPPRSDCCVHIWAAGVNLGWAASFLKHTTARTRFEPADRVVVENLNRAIRHMQSAHSTCSKMNVAWPNISSYTSQLENQRNRFGRNADSRTRQQICSMIDSTYQWANALKRQVFDTNVNTAYHYETCSEKYFKIGFDIAYAHQSLLIAEEWATAGRNNWTEPVSRAHGHLSRALRVFLEYANVVSGTCVAVNDLNVFERFLEIQNIPIQKNKIRQKIDLATNLWQDLQNRMERGCTIQIIRTARPEPKPETGSYYEEESDSINLLDVEVD